MAGSSSSGRGPGPLHQVGGMPNLLYRFESVHRDRLVFDGDLVVGIVCPGCDDEHLGFYAESGPAKCLLDADKASEPRRLAENKAVARHWTEELSEQYPFIVRHPRPGDMGRRVHRAHCRALRRVTRGDNYYGAMEKPDGFAECRLCFDWTGEDLT